MTVHDSARSRTARVRALPWGRASLVVLLLLALAGGYEAYRLRAVMADVNAGRAQLRDGQGVIERRRLDASPEDLATARGDFWRAGASFQSARSALDRDRAVAVAAHLPWLGGQVGAARALTDIGIDAAAIGAAGVDAADAFNTVRAQGDGTLPEKTQQVFAAVDPKVAGIEQRLASVDASRAAIGSGWLAGPMRRGVDELDARRQRLADFLQTYQRARAFTPEFLGFNGTRTYLVLAQNEAELLPSGGLVSVVGTVRLTDGRVDDMQFQDAVRFGSQWMERTNAYVEPPKPLKQYLLKDTSWNLAVSNWSPDFLTSAQSAQRFWELGGGGPVDGVIALDVRTLVRLLAVVGAVDVPEYDVTVDANNAFDLTEQYTREAYAVQGNGDRKAFTAVLADRVLRKVLRPEAGQWSQLIDTVQLLGDEKDMQLYIANDAQEKLVREFGWDGRLQYTGGDYLQLVDASVNSTKLNAVIDRKATVDVQLAADGATTTTVRVDYTNDLKSWERGRDPVLVEKLMLKGLYGGYLRLLTPPGSRIVSVTDGQGEVGLEETGREQGLTVFGRFFAMPRDTSRALSFTYTTPSTIVQRGSDWTYTLQLRRQPGWELPSLTVRVAPPDGMRTSAILIDGEPAASNEGGVKVDLSRDRTLTVRMRG